MRGALLWPLQPSGLSAILHCDCSSCNHVVSSSYPRQWDAEKPNQGVADLAHDMVMRRLDEARALLSGIYFEHLAGAMLAHIEERYLQVTRAGARCPTRHSYSSAPPSLSLETFL